MDATLLETPLVMPPDGLHKSTTDAEAARLRGLEPPAYWLEIANELQWTTPPTVGLQGTLGDFTYFAGATGNPSVQCIDRWPADRVALHYEREDIRSWRQCSKSPSRDDQRCTHRCHHV